MKITCLIESLGSGGAERQLCTLAIEMRRRGHEVQLVTYAHGDFFLPMLEKGGVKHVFLGGKSRLTWLRRIRRLLRSNQQDVVLAYLKSCAAYAELSALPVRRWGLVVSERSAASSSHLKLVGARRWLHLLPDSIITNSHTSRLLIEAAAPSLQCRILTIYNAVDLEKFRPMENISEEGRVRLLIAARLDKNKNIEGTIDAVHLLRSQYGIRVSVDWFGNTSVDRALLQKCQSQIKDRKMQEYFHIHDVTEDIISRYQLADAVMLPSFYEGLPNTVCEAMACGKPILMSAVCDAGNLVKDGENGFLFSPHDPASIADAIKKFSSLNEKKRRTMGRRSRQMAKRYFDLKKIADLYELVLWTASQRRRPDCGHWVPDVPKTALTHEKLLKATITQY